MIQALLAAADPLERMQRGASAADYEPLAGVVLGALRQGADVGGVMLLLNDHAASDPARPTPALTMVAGFAQAAVDWWANAEPR